MLTVENIAVHYGRIQALRGVSLHVVKGEVVTIIGANGAGKTSLLNAITGVLPTSSGVTRLNGKSVTGLPAHRITNLGVGYVPEGREIFTSMSVLDNLLLGSYQFCANKWWQLLGPSGSFARQEAVVLRQQRVFDLFPRLAERQKQRAGSLSGGEQQMLAIGRALMGAPEILLLDEPSNGLAPNLVRELLQLLGRLRGEGLTILLVEQDAMAALRIADRGYVLERGQVVVEGTAGELLGTDRVRHAYLGRAAGQSWRER